MDRRQFVSSMAALGSLPMNAPAVPAVAPAAEILIEPDQPASALAHYWEACAGSGHARLALRAQWLEDLALARRKTGLRAVRFHGLLDDDMGVCGGIGASGPNTNFLYVDEVYDRMLELGVRPFVELSFMPGALASSANTVFWYQGNTSPPRRMQDWRALVSSLAQHLVERYGIDEVARWRFECWNEPNLTFWSAPREQYFELYRYTASALKAVSPRLQVGGPATAQMMWIPEFLAHCDAHGAPVDFVSSHIYPDDPQQDVFGQSHLYAREQVMPRALQLANEHIRASAYPHAPLVISEWSSTDPAFIAQMIRDCAGLADTMSFWTFSNVFEEQGPNRSFMNDTYGWIGQRGVPRQTLQVFALLHRLGEQRVLTQPGPVLASRRADGSLAILVWHLDAQRYGGGTAGNPIAPPSAQRAAVGPPLALRLHLAGLERGSARVTLVDPAHDPVRIAYAAMGSPPYPTLAQIRALRAAADTTATSTASISNGRLQLAIPSSAVALLEIG